jgi:ubiquitin-conjugating enzyme E2 S
VNTLKKDWSSTFGIAHILVTVKCLLIYPNPESALDEEAGKLLLEDYESYCERARLITSIHATPKVRPAEFNTPSAATKEAAAGSSKAITPTTSLSPPTATNTTSQISPTSQKSGSPQPHSQPLQSTTTSNTPSLPPPTKDKERHVSPAPLSTADANLGANAGTTPKTTAVVSGGSKAVKRSATGAAGTGAEKRKKALKRL